MKLVASVSLVVCLGAFFGAISPAHAYTINTTELGHRIRWARDSVPMQIDPALESFLPEDQARAAVTMAFEAWRGLPRVPDLMLAPGAPSAKPGNHGGSPTNGVYLLRKWPYEPAKLAITVITYEMETGRLLDADVLVNGETKFALLDEGSHTKSSDYDLGAVLTHESGHVLGLGESAADPGATMWPYAMPGETQKRTLAKDDEDGVTASYLSHPPAAANGCSSLSVAGRRDARHGLALLVFALSFFGLRAKRRSRLRLWARALPLLMLTSIVGFGAPLRTNDPTTTLRERVRGLTDMSTDQARTMVRAAADGSDPAARVDALEALAQLGTRDEQAIAERLCSDEDARVAARAHVALQEVMARAPRAALPAQLPEAAARLTRLYGDANTLIRGHARLTSTVSNDGLLFSEYSVRAADGGEHVLRLAGGTLGPIGQRALDGEPPPADDQDVVIAPQSEGRAHWAYEQGGRVFGGDLGDGPSITGAL